MADNALELSSGSPKEVGMSSTQLERASGLLASAVEAQQISAASLTVARCGKVVYAAGHGRRRPDEGEAVDADSVFLLASITKPVTACALMILVDRGLISLDDPAVDYLPEYVGGDRSKVLVRHLLSHISGMPDMLPENVSLRRAHQPVGEFVKGALQTPLLYEPATNFRYQSKGILLAAEIVERVSGTSKTSATGSKGAGSPAATFSVLSAKRALSSPVNCSGTRATSPLSRFCAASAAVSRSRPCRAWIWTVDKLAKSGVLSLLNTPLRPNPHMTLVNCGSPRSI